MNITGLSYHFAEKKLFQNLNLSLPSPSFLLIRGPSGCGKSTFLKLIAGLVDLQAGEVQLPAHFKIGYVHQDCHLIEHWSVLENLSLICADHELKNSWLKKFGLSNTQNSLVKTLSGGEKQRLSLVRLLLQNPDLALLDEPTAHLDDKNAMLCMQYIKEALKDKIVIIVSHDHRVSNLAQDILDWSTLTKAVSHA